MGGGGEYENYRALVGDVGIQIVKTVIVKDRLHLATPQGHLSFPKKFNLNVSNKHLCHFKLRNGYTVKKGSRVSRPQPGLSLGGKNDVITELFLPRGSLVSDIPAGDGKLVNLFLRCMDPIFLYFLVCSA